MKMTIEGALVGVGLAALGFATGYIVAAQNASRYQFFVDDERAAAWRLDTRTGETSVVGSRWTPRVWKYMTEPSDSMREALDEDGGG